MKQIPTLKPGHQEQRTNPDKEKEINLKGMAYLDNGRKAPVLILNEREGGLGVEISSNIIKTKDLRIDDAINIETVIKGKRVKIKLIVKHIKEIDNKRNKSYVGLQYAKGNKLSLLDNSFTV